MTLISLALDIWTIEIEKERDSNVMAGRDSCPETKREKESRVRERAALQIKSETTSQFTVVARADRIIYMNRTFK